MQHPFSKLNPVKSILSGHGLKKCGKQEEASHADNREMYQVFNMGCRMEIYTDEEFAKNVVSLAKSFNIHAQIIGRVEESKKKELVIELVEEKLVF